MSFIIKHQRKGKSEAQILVESKKEEELTKAQLLVLGQKTKDNMLNVISQNSKQAASPKGLRNSIKLYPFAKGGWGIGKISELAKWWASLNWGGNWTITAKNVKVLKFKGKDGKWVYRKSVNHIQSPLNYIERTINYLTGLLTAFKLRK